MILKSTPSSYVKVRGPRAQLIGGDLPLRVKNINVTLTGRSNKSIWSANSAVSPMVFLPQSVVVIFKRITYDITFKPLEILSGSGYGQFTVSLTDNAGVSTNIIEKSTPYYSCSTVNNISGVYDAGNKEIVISGTKFNLQSLITEGGSYIANYCGGIDKMSVLFEGVMEGFF